MNRVTLHLSVQKQLVAKIDKLAAAENRSRLNMIVVLLQAALSSKEGIPA